MVLVGLKSLPVMKTGGASPEVLVESLAKSNQWTLGQMFFYREEAKRAKEAKNDD
jgi:hypothetical protein